MTDAVTDTFTGADNTVVSTSHTGEVGATWTVNTHFGPGSDDEFLIRSNSLARSIWPQPDNSGEALIYPSGTLPGGTTHFVIEFPLVWDANTSESFIAIYEQADVAGNAEFLFDIENQLRSSGGGTGGIMTLGPPATYNDTIVFVPTVGQTYQVQLDVNGTTLTLKVDGVTMTTWSRAAMPIEPFGIDMYEHDGEGLARIPSFRIYPSGPPPPSAFWQDFVISTETDA